MKPEYTKIIKENKTSYLNGILQCLANIELLKKYFMNREILKVIFDEDAIISNYFYKIIQDMWSLDNEEVKNNIYEELKSKISEFSPIENILDNPKLLIFLRIKLISSSEKWMKILILKMPSALRARLGIFLK